MSILTSIHHHLQIPESPRYSADVLGQKERAAADARHVLRENRDRQLLTGINTYKEKVAVVENKATNGPTFAQHFGEWKNLKVLIGASVTWFCLDVAFYGTNLNT